MDQEKDKKAYAHAEKAYMQGTMFPFIKVGMQKVNLTPTVNIVDGEKVMTPNAPVYIYDTSGPFSDPNIEIDLMRAGLHHAAMWNSCLRSLQNTERCAVMISHSIISVSSISHCHTVPRKVSAVLRCTMPSRVS